MVTKFGSETRQDIYISVFIFILSGGSFWSEIPSDLTRRPEVWSVDSVVVVVVVFAVDEGVCISKSNDNNVTTVNIPHLGFNNR